MLYHLSIDADDPRNVASFFAQLWDGAALPFPPVAEGSWLAHAGDLRRSMIEVYPRGTEFFEAEGDADAIGVPGDRNRRSATHMAVGTALSREAVMALAEREGWPAKYRKRGGAFGVIELWVEGCRMVEVLTPEMRDEYIATMTIPAWRGFVDSIGIAA